MTCRPGALIILSLGMLLGGCRASKRQPSAGGASARIGCPNDAEGLVMTLGPNHCSVARAVYLGTDPKCLADSLVRPETRTGDDWISL